MDMMEKSESRIGWIRVTAAFLLSLLFLAILIPHTGRIHLDRSTQPPSLIITDRPRQIATLVSMLAVPLSWIYLGARRYRSLELVGWFLLIALFAWATCN